MNNYTAHTDRLLEEYRSASRSTQERFFAVDARTTRDGAGLFAELREKLREREQQVEEQAVRELAARRAQEERERLAHAEAERARAAARQRTNAATYGRHAIAQPTDWTDEDEALDNGQPVSWLK